MTPEQTTPATAQKIRIYHVVGHTQWLGSCHFHLFRDCRHLVRPRTMGPMDMTGCTAEDTAAPDDRRICRHCLARKKARPKPA